MSLVDALPDVSTANDFTLLEGLYQLAVSGHTSDTEFEQIDRVVYDRLMSSYDSAIVGSARALQSLAG
ncbi:hypothetical protein [Pseudoxanthomonas dokdonensis]|uniref:Uncharacterized protein n=1 Tax=Pseudoxanthomonas dokdonensis TaxID=344882 RepID=A0A0R0CG47_9GAMM|nr:hypothetical protein [Pseudoxanthomonas dokdonensis]KRG68780.1 hypothetical protein ABB29_09785 [Pseudoxanthomonas dokdonensis]